ncbi:hypothetical protein [Pseudoxanthomonas sp. PXM02]|uniref:DUF6197 family protein n=1 Tax=Pseudoxanthomonas sp. PXM02 TaxID=2769294 RepID=UPI001783F481|nr:hypothetical protein [Pseudoxanthomonas sp. PXM02]MBD9477681.1 hypothetical protein [Pseudoxanthomonas sp. PXM02]
MDARTLRRSLPLRVAFGLVACLSMQAHAQTPPDPAAREKFGDPAQYEARNLPVTVDDLKTLERAATLLQDEASWNRNDDRQCADDEAANKRSLFCALQRASADVYGSHDPRRVADHRRVALQEVRFAVEEATRGRELAHRLMDFNNLPDTTLADVQRVIAQATARVRARLATE